MLLTWRDGRTAGPLRLDDAMAADGGFRDLRGSNALHPRNLTWNLKISPWKRKVHLETIIFRFHVKFRGCTPLEV